LHFHLARTLVSRLFSFLFQKQLMVFRTFAEHFGAALGAMFILATHALAVRDCGLAFWTYTMTAFTHHVFTMLCHDILH